MTEKRIALDIKAKCTKCSEWTAGRLYLEGLRLCDSDGGLVFNDGWQCHNCLGEPWSSSDLVVGPSIPSFIRRKH